MVEGLLCIKQLFSTESNESPSSFLMSSSSLSRFTALTALTDFVSEPAEETTALDVDLTPACAPAMLLLFRVTTMLFLRKSFPLGFWSLLDSAECCRVGERPKSKVKSSAGLGLSLPCLRLRMRFSISATLHKADAWEPRREERTFLARWAVRMKRRTQELSYGSRGEN